MNRCLRRVVAGQRDFALLSLKLLNRSLDLSRRASDRAAFAIIGAVVILGLVLWSCYCCESCPMYDHWNPRAKEKRNQNLQQPIIGGTYQQPTQVGTVVP